MSNPLGTPLRQEIRLMFKRLTVEQQQAVLGDLFAEHIYYSVDRAMRQSVDNGSREYRKARRELAKLLKSKSPYKKKDK